MSLKPPAPSRFLVAAFYAFTPLEGDTLARLLEALPALAAQGNVLGSVLLAASASQMASVRRSTARNVRKAIHSCFPNRRNGSPNDPSLSGTWLPDGPCNIIILRDQQPRDDSGCTCSQACTSRAPCFPGTQLRILYRFVSRGKYRGPSAIGTIARSHRPSVAATTIYNAHFQSPWNLTDSSSHFVPVQSRLLIVALFRCLLRWILDGPENKNSIFPRFVFQFPHVRFVWIWLKQKISK